MTGFVDLDVDGRVATVTLDRPAHGNQVTAAMMQELATVLGEADDAGTDLLVLRGNGPDFCIGRDQEEDPPDLSKRENLALIFDANAALAGFDGISIAAVDGRALGFGAGAAVQCDVTLAADDAVFAFNEIDHGFAPTIVMTWLETYVDRKAALDLLLTGRSVPAAEAKEMGLATRVMDARNFESYVDGFVANMASRNADALRTCKTYLDEIRDVPPEDRKEYALDTI